MKMQLLLVGAFVAAGSMIACESVATMTRVTATGGAYTLYAASENGVQDATRQALDQIADRCGGVFEITALEKVPQPRTRHGWGYYLELDGTASSGFFLTEIDYDCRAPKNLGLNQLLDAVAHRAPTRGKDSPVEPLKSCQSDLDCDGIALTCYEGFCRS